MSEAEKVVLCGANAYEKKYYLNNRFDRLPETIKQELQIACVKFTENAGGILLLEFNEEGKLIIETRVDNADIYHDDIETGMQVSKLQREKEELFEQLELFYKIINEAGL